MDILQIVTIVIIAFFALYGAKALYDKMRILHYWFDEDDYVYPLDTEFKRQAAQIIFDRWSGRVPFLVENEELNVLDREMANSIIHKVEQEARRLKKQAKKAPR